MSYLYWLVAIALGMGFAGLTAFLWSLRSGQYDDLDGAAQRILLHEENDTPLAQEARTELPAMARPNGDVTGKLQKSLARHTGTKGERCERRN